MPLLAAASCAFYRCLKRVWLSTKCNGARAGQQCVPRPTTSNSSQKALWYCTVNSYMLTTVLTDLRQMMRHCIGSHILVHYK